MADFAKPISQLGKRAVQVDPAPGQAIALDHLSMIPVNALGSGTTASNVFLAGDRSWRTVAGGGGGGSYAIVASNTTFSNTTVSISGFGAATINTAANLIRVSVPTQTAETAISGVAASNTTYTSGTITITGVGGGVTVSSNTGQRVDISVAAQSVQTQNMVAVSVSNTMYSSGTFTISGSGAVTVKTGAAQGITIDAARSIAGLGDTAATTYTSGNVSMVPKGDITIGSTGPGQGIYFSVSTGGGGGASISHWKLVPGGVGGQQTIAVPNAQIMFVPIWMDANLTGHIARIFVSAAGASNSSAQMSWSVNIYTKTGTKLSTVSAASSSSSWTSNSVAAGDWLGVSGQKRWDITNANFSFTPGDYVVGIWQRSTNAGSYSYMAESGLGNAFSGKLGAVSNTTIGAIPGAGGMSVSTAALPNTVAYSDIQHWLNNNQKPPDFAFLHSSYSDV